MSEEKPVVASLKPSVLDLEPGSYYWCSCGKSAHQPFCDGAHHGSSFQPVRFELTEPTKLALCNCKASEKGHICDGAHKLLPK